MSKVSILISLYNSDHFIKNFLYRLNKQTFINDVEPIFIINDGKNNLTIKEVESFENKNKKTIYTKLECLYRSWNRALEVSSGEYVCNMNCDDYHYYNAIEIMVKCLDDNLDFGLCRGRCEHTDKEIFDFNSMNMNIDNKYVLCEKNNRDCGPFPMWRKEIHDKIGNFCERYAAVGDHEMWLRMLKNGFRFLTINSPTCVYYNRPDTLSNRVFNSRKEIIDVLKEYEGYESFFKE